MADAVVPSVPETPTFERVPAAEGSLLHGWAAVAYPFRSIEKARRTIAAWAGATTNARIVWTLLVAATIDVCSGSLGVAFTTKGRLSVHAPGLSGVGSGASGALFHLIEFFASALTATVLITLLRYGTFCARFRRLLRPWALVQPAIAVAGLLSALISVAQMHIGDINTPILGGTFEILAGLDLLKGLEIVLLVYVLSLAQPALAVGAYRFRYDQVLVLLAFLTWIGTYIGFHALTGWLASILRIGT